MGLITQAEGRLIQIVFPAANEERAYAIENAPLSRVVYRVGDSVRDEQNNKLTVVDVVENRGVLIYLCQDANAQEILLPELKLHGVVQLTGPKDRLFAGQIDRLSRYRLRYQTRLHEGALRQSPVTGLLGPRVQLLPHQIYIAHEVARRHAPRVLLADEVGLGKTIEAGLIVHQQLITGRAARVLIVVPEPLLHQWLVEMLRRFNLRFSLLDESRCRALEASEADRDELDDEDAAQGEMLPGGYNPFESAQLILCGESFLAQSGARQAQAQAAGWDLLVVDEAHHLRWTPETASRAYRCIETLAERVPGLLLLTATPEQLGSAGHFARLRLLDPQRYHSLEDFLAEEARYQQVSTLLIALRAEDGWQQLESQDALRAELDAYLGEQHVEQALQAAEEAGDKRAALDKLVGELLDRHGTGRVLFRNTRASVGGFPGRALHAWPQAAPADSSGCEPGRDLLECLQPERGQAADWPARDARVQWLLDFLREHRQDKVLLICAAAETAKALESHLRLGQGVYAGLFHEGLSLVERDRAAAWFADSDDGAQILLCSEIGSEGRNFQFAQHLVLFDLPLDPDLLEQRIGRLDRIGQQGVVHIHVPYFAGSAQEQLLHWYRDGLGAFERPFPAGQAVMQAFGERLAQALLDGEGPALEALVEETAAFCTAELARLESGRDRLLEMNSCQPQRAAQVLASIQDYERSGVLTQYMEQVFDEFGVEHESHSADTLIARPGNHMQVQHFPGLPEEDFTATFRRQIAMVREDMQFLSWEHPMVSGAMDMVLSGDFGNTALCTVKLGGVAAGTVLVEAIFVLSAQAPRALQLQRYLPAEPVRLLRDNLGRDLSDKLSADQLHQLAERVPKHTSHALVKRARPILQQILEALESQAAAQQEALILTALTEMEVARASELQRLEALARVNPNIRAPELAQHRADTAQLMDHLGQASLQLDAVRVAVAT